MSSEVFIVISAYIIVFAISVTTTLLQSSIEKRQRQSQKTSNTDQEIPMLFFGLLRDALNRTAKNRRNEN